MITQTGRSMLETMGVLLIIVVLTAAIFAMFSYAIDRYKASRTVDQIYTLSMNIDGLYAEQRNYQDIDWPTLATSNLIPAGITLNDTKTQATNLWKGDILLFGTPTPNSMYVITYTHVPSMACQTLAVKAWRRDDFARLIIDDQSFPNFQIPFLPLPAETAKDICNRQNRHTLSFYFY